MKIFALIVTCNRLELLKEALSALKNQSVKPYKILVYNNNSSDGTAEYLKTISDEQVIGFNAEKNTGGAGGFHFGIEESYKLGADWIWLMDDDSIPEQDALEKLIQSPFFPSDEYNNPTGYFASRVDWTDGSRHLMNYIKPVHPWHSLHGIHDNCYRISNSTFVSMLINRKAVKSLGLPVKEFFIWGDDWEYSGRISSKYNCYYISDSIVVHKTPENLESNVRNINKENYWKYKYDARNSSSLSAGGFKGFIKVNLNLIIKINRMLESKVRLKYIFAYMFCSYQGLFFNYRKYIKFPE